MRVFLSQEISITWKSNSREHGFFCNRACPVGWPWWSESVAVMWPSGHEGTWLSGPTKRCVNDKRLGLLQHGSSPQPGPSTLSNSLGIRACGKPPQVHATTRVLALLNTTVHTHSEHAALPYSVPQYTYLPS